MRICRRLWLLLIREGLLKIAKITQFVIVDFQEIKSWDL